MILRAWAMYGKSKLILGILLILYLPQIIFAIIVTIFTFIPNNLSAGMYHSDLMYGAECWLDVAQRIIFRCWVVQAVLKMLFYSPAPGTPPFCNLSLEP